MQPIWQIIQLSPNETLTIFSWGLRGGAGESVSPLCEPLFLFPKSDLLSETDCGKGLFQDLAVWPPLETNDIPLFFSAERKAAKDHNESMEPSLF